jgi:ribosomal protein S27E
MSALLAERTRPRLAPRAVQRLRAPGGRPTLDDVMTSAWEGLSARLPVECPVCDAAMHAFERPGSGGRCVSCAATLG